MTTLAGNDPDRSRDYVEVYVDGAGEHRWRYKAGNGQIIAVSGEGYRSGVDALRGLGIVTGRVPTFDETGETKSAAIGPNNIRVVRLPDTKDRRPHSRACGPFCAGHGPACSPNCPTCHGKAIG